MDQVKSLVSVLALIAASPALAQQQPSTVTNMPFASTPLSGSELLYIVQGGQPRKTTVGGLGFAPLNNPVFTGTVTLPGGGLATPHVANNAALQAIIPTAVGQVYVRDGFYAAGDGGQATYTSAAGACSTPDNGAQVQPTGAAYCWTVQASAALDIRVWPVKGTKISFACTLANNCDDGPGIRAASAYSALTGTHIKFPINVVYEINTLDNSTLGGIVVGPQPITTTSAPTSASGSSVTLTSVSGVSVGDNVAVITTTGDRFGFVVNSIVGNVVSFGSYSNISSIASGASFWDYNSTVPSGAPIFEGQRPITNAGYCGYLTQGVGTIQIGPNLNRPLIYSHPQTASIVVRNECLDGNRNNQSGWYGGGPGYTGHGDGRLYTVQLSDGTTTFLEGSMTTEKAGITGGYNGALYQGNVRGILISEDTWYSYNGQSTYDVTLLMNGYDSYILNPTIGDNTGIGINYSEGIQHQLIGGAIFSNYTGIVLNGGIVGSFNASGGTNISGNICGSVIEANVAPNGGNYAGGHVFDGVIFDSNSTQAAGVCNEIEVGSSYLSLISPVFSSRTTATPSYDIHFNNGASVVNVTSPKFSASPYTTAFTNAPAQVIPAAFQMENSWTPVLAGATTAGSPTYVIQKGSWSRNNSEITAKFSIQWSALGGATGNMQITNLPLVSTSSANNFGICTLNVVSGWTGDTGYSVLTAFVGVNSSIVFLYENGSGKTSQPVAVGNLATSGQLFGSCVYNTDQ